MSKLTFWRKPRYTTPEMVERYFLEEYVTGDLVERSNFVATCFEDREKFLMDILLMFKKLTDDYTDKETLTRACSHGVCRALIRHLERKPYPGRAK